MISKKKGLHGNCKGFSARNHKFKHFLRPKTGDLQKKRSSSQKCHEIRCQSTKNTNLGLDLHSSSPDPVNFFGAQSSLGGTLFSFGGAQAVIWGARPRYAPPWCRVWFSTLYEPRSIAPYRESYISGSS